MIGSRTQSVAAVLAGLGLSVSWADDGPKGRQAFDGLKPAAVIEQAIGVADVVFGEDPKGPGETLSFTGPVKIEKWPVEGYARRVLPDGRVEIMQRSWTATRTFYWRARQIAIC